MGKTQKEAGPQPRGQRRRPHLMAVEMERRGGPVSKHPQDTICIFILWGNKENV